MPLPALPQAVISPSRIPRATFSHTPIRERLPSIIKAKLSKDLAAIRNPGVSPSAQSNLYTGVLALLSEVISDNLEDDMDISRHIEAIRRSLTDGHLTDDKAIVELDRLSQFAQKAKRSSEAMLNVYNTLSHLPHDKALATLSEVLNNPISGSSKLPSVTEEPGTIPTVKLQRSESKSALGQRLNRKLAELEDSSTQIEYNSLVVPKLRKTLSGSSMDILERLEQEFNIVDQQLRATRHKSASSTYSTISSTSTSSESQDGFTMQNETPSPAWKPNPLVSAAAQAVIQPGNRSQRASPSEESEDSLAEISPIWSLKSFETIQLSPPENNSLWTKNELHLLQAGNQPQKTGLWNPKVSSYGGQTDQTMRSRHLWSPRIVHRRQISSTGLWNWNGNSASTRGESRSHREWSVSESQRYPRPRRKDQFLPQIRFTDRSGLWTKPVMEPEISNTGMWNKGRHAPESLHNSNLTTLSVSTFPLLDEIPFILETKHSSSATESSDVILVMSCANNSILNLLRLTLSLESCGSRSPFLLIQLHLLFAAHQVQQAF